MDNDDYFKDFKLEKYRFIVVNKKTLTPLVWLFDDTLEVGELTYDNNVIFRDPFEIGYELSYYLENQRDVPIGIEKDGDNSIVKWLKHDD